MKPDRINMALRIASEGWQIIPNYPGTKQPIGLNWTQRGSCDPVVIRAWFAQYPDCNYGVIPKPGQVIIDVDPRHGGDKHIGKFGVPPTRTTQSAQGGQQHYLTLPPGITLATCTLIPEAPKAVDAIGPGHQAIGPGSVFKGATGAPFAVTPESVIAASQRTRTRAAKERPSPILRWRILTLSKSAAPYALFRMSAPAKTMTHGSRSEWP